MTPEANTQSAPEEKALDQLETEATPTVEDLTEGEGDQNDSPSPTGLDPDVITLKDIKGAEQAISKILMAQVDFKLAYRIEKIGKKLVSQIEKIEDNRLALVSKYGEPELDKDKKPTGRQAVPLAKHKEFNDEFTKYLEQPLEIAVEQIPYELLEHSGIKVSPADLLALSKFISDPKVPLV